MILAEKHIINESHPSYGKVDNAMLLSKNMYNATLYAVRQEYIHNGKYLSYATLCHQFMEQRNPDYIALPAKVAQHTMKMVDQNMKSYFKTLILSVLPELNLSSAVYLNHNKNVLVDFLYPRVTTL